MATTGLPTPDNFEGDADFICIPLIVPNKTEFKAAIYGLYGQMANAWFWRELGTMTPETAAFLSSRGLGMTNAYGECATMSCEEIADCIETDTVTQEALAAALQTSVPLQDAVFNYVNKAGFGNPLHVSGTNTKIADVNPLGFESDDVKTLDNCDLNALWGGIRHGIVDRLDENLQDILQDISAIPTIIGRNAAWLDVVPVLGDIAEAIVTSLSSVVPTLLSLFEAYSSEATKDELACELFNLVCADCKYPTHEQIYNHFKNYGMPETPEIGEWVLETMTDLLTNPVGVVAKVAYFTLMTWQLGIIYLQSKINNATAEHQLRLWAGLGEDWANDNWLTLCDECQETYQKVVWDFSDGQQGWKIDTLAPIVGKWGGSYWETTNDATSANMRLKVSREIPRTAQVMAYKMEWEVVTGATTFFNRLWKWRPTVGSDSGAVTAGQGTCTNTETGWTASGNDLTTVITNYAQMVIDIFGQPKTSPVTVIRLHRVTLVFNRGFGIDDDMTMETTREICT